MIFRFGFGFIRVAHSPCIGVCRLDPQSRFCIGCFRTCDELAEWGAASEARKEAILELLPGRAAAYSDSTSARSPSTKVGA